MSVRLTRSGRHSRDQCEHALVAPTAAAAGWTSAVARRLRPARPVRHPASAGDASQHEPLTAAVALALVLLYLALGGFILTNDAVLGLVSAALSWVVFALCWFQGFRRGGGRQRIQRTENAARGRRATTDALR